MGFWGVFDLDLEKGQHVGIWRSIILGAVLVVIRVGLQGWPW